MAMVFAGTMRYRVPWDFLLCIPAALGAARSSRGCASAAHAEAAA